MDGLGGPKLGCMCGGVPASSVAQGSVSLPPVRVYPPVSPRPLRSRATPWPKGGDFRLGGTGKLTTTRGESYLNSLNVTRFGSRSAPRFVHLSVFPNPPPSLKCEVELWRPVEAHLLLACRSWAPHLTKRPVDAYLLLAWRRRPVDALCSSPLLRPTSPGGLLKHVCSSPAGFGLPL